MKDQWSNPSASGNSAVTVNSSVPIAEFSRLFRMDVAVRTVGAAQTPAPSMERMTDVVTTARRFQNADLPPTGDVLAE